MNEPAELPTRQPATGKGNELLLLASLTVLCCAMGGLLHFIADVPAATATLTALACLSLLLAAIAMVRRATTVAALNAEIKDLRSEIIGLRGARVATPHSGTISRPPTSTQALQAGIATGIDPVHHAMSQPRAPQPGMVQAGGRSASPGHPGYSIPGPVARQMAPSYRPSHQGVPPGATMPTSPAAPAERPDPALTNNAIRRPLQATGESTPMDSGAALDWSLRPGSHREPTAPIFEVAPNSVAAGPLPLIEPHRHPAEQLLPRQPATAAGHREPSEEAQRSQSLQTTEPATSVVAAIEPPVQPTLGPGLAAPDRSVASSFNVPVEAAAPSPPRSFLDDLQMPESDGAPRAMARPETGAWPQAVPRTPTAPLDLGTMQNLVEQLAGQLDSTAANSSAAEPSPDRASNGTQTHVATARTRLPPSLPRRALPDTAMANRPSPKVVRDDAAPFGHLALIAEALEAKRMDVMLDPILGLSDRRARHFELSVRLISEDGTDLDLTEYRRAAAGTGLLGRIDAAKLSGAVNVLQGLRLRGSAASLFSAVVGESLSDDNFGKAFADMLQAEEGQSTRLVLTFAQSEARTFTDAHWRAVSDLGRVGLKFALTDVTDLDMDFEVLKRHGFDFIKLDASVFLDGLPTPTGHIPSADICRHLSNLGLALIVGGIVAEKDLARVLGFGALLGQGTLFGGPRCVELERERHAA